jgi:hypothetical protein
MDPDGSIIHKHAVGGQQRRSVRYKSTVTPSVTALLDWNLGSFMLSLSKQYMLISSAQGDSCRPSASEEIGQAVL